LKTQRSSKPYRLSDGYLSTAHADQTRDLTAGHTEQRWY